MPELGTTLFKVYDLSHHTMGERLPEPKVMKINMLELLNHLFPRNFMTIMQNAN